jgi:hypothetical protein
MQHRLVETRLVLFGNDEDLLPSIFNRIEPARAIRQPARFSRTRSENRST